MGNNVSLREKKQSAMNTTENVAIESTRKPRLFRWALWWGLGIVVICLAILLVYEFVAPSSANELGGPMMDVFYSMIYQYGIWPVIIFIGLIGPIIEEVSFRLWGNGKLWTGIISIIFMALWCFGIGWWLSLIAVICGVAILVLFRADKTKRLFALMMLSSVLFAVDHISNYDGNWFMVLVGIVHKLGFGLVASYLVINQNILWSIGLHVINNTLMALPLGLSFGQVSNAVVTVENENLCLEVRPVLVHDSSIRQDNNNVFLGSVFLTDADTIYYFGNTANFAQQASLYEFLINPTNDTVRFEADDSYPNCSFILVYKTRPFDYHALIDAMEKEGLINVDTSYSVSDMKTVLKFSSTYDPLTRR